ncbi:1-acyl-sn-glycerol-3-phosphate acyltransferase gamma isoform X10 [Homo sapiens]|uniref:1-acyl-sn-glycerol-3-phosphate acyltransferase gamma isoform X10 n=1 Tax=Homo sapiens TaxID=9606 RepID=UPI0023DE788C|nr:1-acyl-sn-glycerol-3-phosphate acyltransferase gamma isoform X10 [Homo sapiens]
MCVCVHGRVCVLECGPHKSATLGECSSALVHGCALAWEAPAVSCRPADLSQVHCAVIRPWELSTSLHLPPNITTLRPVRPSQHPRGDKFWSSESWEGSCWCDLSCSPDPKGIWDLPPSTNGVGLLSSRLWFHAPTVAPAPSDTASSPREGRTTKDGCPQRGAVHPLLSSAMGLLAFLKTQFVLHLLVGFVFVNWSCCWSGGPARSVHCSRTRPR